jgi:hypothetical protein
MKDHIIVAMSAVPEKAPTDTMFDVTGKSECVVHPAWVNKRGVGGKFKKCPWERIHPATLIQLQRYLHKRRRFTMLTLKYNKRRGEGVVGMKRMMRTLLMKMYLLA